MVEVFISYVKLAEKIFFITGFYKNFSSRTLFQENVIVMKKINAQLFNQLQRLLQLIRGKNIRNQETLTIKKNLNKGRKRAELSYQCLTY